MEYIIEYRIYYEVYLHAAPERKDLIPITYTMHPSLQNCSYLLEILKPVFCLPFTLNLTAVYCRPIYLLRGRFTNILKYVTGKR